MLPVADHFTQHRQITGSETPSVGTKANWHEPFCAHSTRLITRHVGTVLPELLLFVKAEDSLPIDLNFVKFSRDAQQQRT